MDLLLFVKLEGIDTFEAFLEMRLDSQRLFGFR
jgi:hypothetical protein